MDLQIRRKRQRADSEKQKEEGLVAMALHIIPKIAGRTFRAECGDIIKKGERYVVFLDYVMGIRNHESFCVPCWNSQSNIKIDEEGRLRP